MVGTDPRENECSSEPEDFMAQNISSPSDVPLLPLHQLLTSSDKLAIQTGSASYPANLSEDDHDQYKVTIEMLHDPSDKLDPVNVNILTRPKTSEIVAALSTYCISSILMTVTNKYVLSNLHFQMNFLLLAIQVSVFYEKYRAYCLIECRLRVLACYFQGCRSFKLSSISL